MIGSLLRLDFTSLIASLVGVLVAMSVHEMAHALVSWWLGDPTAKNRGRLSLNPLDHIDWAGLLCLLLLGFGWARPVPVDSRYYKDEKAGIVWTSFAGPAANVLCAFLAGILYYGLLYLLPASFLGSWAGQLLLAVFSAIVSLNVGFAVFNLIPIPPLDGAKIFWAFLPDDLYYKYMQPQPWMSLVLIFLIFSRILNTPLYLMRSTLIDWISQTAIAFWNLFF